MTDLDKKNCIPCRGGISPFDISEIHKYLKKERLQKIFTMVIIIVLNQFFYLQMNIGVLLHQDIHLHLDHMVMIQIIDQ